MHILYTFRRCPYAIRARMALLYAQILVDECEVDIKNKPQKLLEISPKGTVPVLALADGRVLDQSLDIMKWALAQEDPAGWLVAELETQIDDLIILNDTRFKPLLDNYKYPQRSEKNDPVYYREQAQGFLNQLNSLLAENKFLLSDYISCADVAIFPFVRQFYLVDMTWFENSEYNYLKKWLGFFLNSPLFLQVMNKRSG